MNIEAPVKSSGYFSHTILTRDKDGTSLTMKCVPHWTIEFGSRLPFDQWDVYNDMRQWLRDNVNSRDYEVHHWSANTRCIEAITFHEQDDAILFYVRFK